MANVVVAEASSSYAMSVIEAFVVPLVSKSVAVTHGSAILQLKEESLFGHNGNE